LATQIANGLWSAKVLELTTTKTIPRLLIAGTKRVELIKEDIGLFRDIKPNEWYTLVGLKLLADNFKKDEPAWRQTADKARKILNEDLGLYVVENVLFFLEIELALLKYKK
jgi:hypothetical protein